MKEIWRIRPEKHRPGRVIHGMVVHELLNAFGGMWLYDMKDNLVSFGVVTALDSKNPYNDPHLGRAAHEDAPLDARAPRGRRARALRREGDPDRRALRAAEALRGRRAPRRRRGGLLQRDEALGRPPGDEVRHDGRGDDRRRAREGRLQLGDARRHTPSATARAGPTRSTGPTGTSTAPGRRASRSSS